MRHSDVEPEATANADAGSAADPHITTDTERIRLLWAKTKQGTDERHALLYHLVDSGQVALALWRLALTPSIRAYFASAVGQEEEDAGRLLAFWVALHDLGKASPAFQVKCAAAAAELAGVGFGFPDPRAFTPEPHGLVTAWGVAGVLRGFGLGKWEAGLLARALGAHHGTLSNPLQFDSPHRLDNLGGPEWEQARMNLVSELRAVFAPPQAAQLPAEGARLNAFLALLAGWAAVADWLASIADRFWCPDRLLPLGSYVRQAVETVEKAVKELGWAAWQPDGRSLPFEGVFPFAPNDVQTEVVEGAGGAALPALAIVEAPTGSGKTEAALYLAQRWLEREGGRGLYVAMPTQATSNQMFGRTADFLSHRYPSQLVNLQLAHGQAAISESQQELVLASVDEDTPARVAALEWFLPRKRALLAPFGVGTVDQCFLAVLQARHFFVRLFGLSGKVVVFDEVHAYDTYMGELFWRLLRWLREAGASVIVLSATLPNATRDRLIAAYGGKPREGAAPTAGPSLTLVAQGRAETQALPPGPSRQVGLRRLPGEPASVVGYLGEQLKAGGCAVVICNTVGRAQAVYRAIREANLVAPAALLLFHARYPFAWRQEREREVLARFGKSGCRPSKAIVVATQVIEQSLDLDFDYMVSDLCPVDLLVQRVGRLWRHPRPDRPAATPELAMVEPPLGEDGQPIFGADGFVYAPYHLLRTRACLDGRSHLELPADAGVLVEAVYGDGIPAGLDGRTVDALARLQKEMQASIANARRRLIAPPEDESFIVGGNVELADDDPSVHSALQALTREAPQGISLVCLHRLSDGRLGCDPDSAEAVELEVAPDPATARRLLNHALSVQWQDLVSFFAKQPPVPAWREHPALRHCRPVVFDRGVYAPDGLAVWLHLDRELGLYVSKEG